MKFILSIITLLPVALVSAQYNNFAYRVPYNLAVRQPDPYDDIYTRTAMDFEGTIFDEE